MAAPTSATSAISTAAQVTLVGVDWGTTHRRAYALAGNGSCVASCADGDGALAARGRHAESLAGLLLTLQAQPRSVVLSGMVGSALGWVPVPYLDASVPLLELPRHLQRVPVPGSAVAQIVPGYCVRSAAGQPDVMRGEETQLLGAVVQGCHTGWFVLPGTHSKWVELQGGHIVSLRTYMTGELFDLLGREGTLAAAGAGEGTWSEEAFAEGVAASASGALSHLLFGCRARVVCGDMPATAARSYLSGLLIGHEMHAVLRPALSARRGAAPESFRLIGTPALAEKYAACARLLGLELEVLDAQQVFLSALGHFQAQEGAP